ncbi:MAG: hypothetical protein WD267_07690 [Balneolales bacterium]
MELQNQPGDSRSDVLSVKDWMITILITFIPIVNIIMYFVWAFGENTNYNKANWAKAILLWAVISFIFGILFLGFLGFGMMFRH